MNKQEFIEAIRKKLSKFPKNEIEDRISFYSEIIDDKIEEGLSEENAIKEIGGVDEIVSQIAGDIPILKLVKENIKPKKKLNAWEISLIAIGSPIWISILISIIAIIFSVYVSLWAVIASLWAVVVSLVAVAFYGTIYGGIMMILGDISVNLVLFSLGLASVGLAIFLCLGAIYATRGLIALTKKLIFTIKNSFVKKEKE